jgi:hypothetical protein
VLRIEEQNSGEGKSSAFKKGDHKSFAFSIALLHFTPST